QNLTQEQEKDYKDAFNVFDKDSDGNISSKELGIVMRSIGINPTEAELQDMIREVDSSATGLINYEQFKSIACRKTLSSDAEEEVREALRIFDKKGTGFINSAELRYVFSSLGEKLADEEADEAIRSLDPENTGEINIDRATKILFGTR
ncbi:hypothetical protein MXB_902, partial [Myxobolus squamalis]